MKSRRHTVPIWKELNVFDTQILVWNKNLQNCRHSTKKYQYKKFLLRLYMLCNLGTHDKTYKVTSEDPLSLASGGNISAIISQGNGPSPRDRDATNTVRLT